MRRTKAHREADSRYEETVLRKTVKFSIRTDAERIEKIGLLPDFSAWVRSKLDSDADLAADLVSQKVLAGEAEFPFFFERTVQSCGELACRNAAIIHDLGLPTDAALSAARQYATTYRANVVVFTAAGSVVVCPE